MFAPRPGPAGRFLALPLLALVTAALADRPASASFIATTTVNSSDVQVVSFTLDGQAETARAGAFRTTLSTADGIAVTGPLTTYCVDVVGSLQSRQEVTSKSIDALDGGYGSYVGSLYANFASGATTAAQKAGLQLAIWKTEYDGPGATTNTGRFVVTSASQEVLDQAAYYYFNNRLVANSVAYFQVVPGTVGQSLVGPSLAASNTTSPAAVPEPGSLVLLGLGLVVGLNVAGRRQCRSQISA